MSGVRVFRDERCVTVCFDGTRSNALDHDRYTALREAADSVRSDQVLVVRSNGRNFCAGQDLDAYRQAVRMGRAGEEMRYGASAILALLRCAGPVVVCVQGAAVGAGALIVAAADVAVLADDAYLRLPELQLGMALGLALVERIVPPPLARRMMLLGERVSAAEIGSLGGALVCDLADLDSELTKVVASTMKLDPGVVAVARRLWGSDERERTALAYEREVAAQSAAVGG